LELRVELLRMSARAGKVNQPTSKNEIGENAMPKAQFVVRATVADASKRAAFDAWCSREHLPDAA